MVRKLSFLLIGAIALMLAACGGGGGGATTNGNASGVSLNETYDADGVSFKYPTGWVVQKPAAPGGPVMLGNNQAALDSVGGTDLKAASGQQGIVVYPFTGAAFQAMSATIKSPVDL